MQSTSNRTFISASLALAFGLLSSCAHYTLPVTHLETPETLGASAIGRVELGALMTGADLNASPTTQVERDQDGNVTSTYLQGGQGILAGSGFVLRLGPRTEAGIRVLPLAPVSLRVKHQLAGEDESASHRGSYSIAVVGSPGFITGDNGGLQASFFSFDLALVGGYRLWERHLFTLTPFFSLASLSNVTETGTSATQFGAGLGYQYLLENFFVRGEIALSSGSLSSTRIGGIYFGALLGLNLPGATREGEPLLP